MKISRLIGQFFGIVLLVSLVGYILISNFSPFNVTTEYSLTSKTNAISPLGPKDRVGVQSVGGQKFFVQKHDLIYFTTPMPFQYDSATVRIIFLNQEPDQTLSLGFQDQPLWHYNTQLFDVPILNSLTWKRIGINPTLYQREPNYSSVSAFLLNPPTDSLIGTYSYDTGIGQSTNDVKLPDYTPSSQDTIISTPLRGRHVLYAYLNNEPFRMTINKQDLNWYEDPDPMSISIYKDHTLVYSAQIDDDGITDNSKKSLPPQEVTIKNPGPGLPEPGVYKIILDANSDTVITRIETNLHKIVVQGNIFLAGNKEIY
ncbi:MAG TPA: hypothetical protein VEW42_02310, partial [Candidatus Eisenbacteria bacterium]|nr:hypothetical protein [Candidatus Eisenbacteria bacterium]